MKRLLQNLAGAPGPSAYEEAVRKLIKAEVASLVDEIRMDVTGSLIAHRRPSKAGGVRLMLAVSIDEPGLMARHIDQDGFIHFSPIGSFDSTCLPGSRVQFLKNIRGVVSTSKEVASPAELIIDVGAANSRSSPVEVGDVAVFERSFNEAGGRLMGAALGSRIGAVVAIEALRQLASMPNDLYIVFTAQGQVGGRGARTAAYGIEPEIAISLGAAPAGDFPGASSQGLCLGQGPAIKIRDDVLLADPRLVEWMVKIATRTKIPFQREVVARGGSGDAAPIQISLGGVTTGALSIPVRYLGSPSELLDMQDVQSAVKLLGALLRSPVKL